MNDEAPRNHEVEIRRECPDAEIARILARSLSPDNEAYATARSEGAILKLVVRARSLRELQRSVDDVLACLGAAERSLVKASPTRAGTHSARKPTP
ncbi:MAG: CTAG/PCC1 family protein [Candidatus Thermoplasmatota archaeon]|jgi:hypothetical protein|nr:CTAG/PCC1 family protein [Candidatus Thermoplasmatota archaeon]MCL5984375.1 CTAG/PCC1 family protein [Candidatus Thermoplasmatota archaeon]